MRSLRPSLLISLGCLSLLLFPLCTNVDAKARVPDRIRREARAFDLADVRLLDGPFKQAMLLDAKYLLRLEPDLHHTRYAVYWDQFTPQQWTNQVSFSK